MRSLFGQKQTTPETPEYDALARRFERRVRLSQLALLGERVWEALLWPFLVVTVFLIVSLLDLWPLLPPLAHRAALGAFGIALLWDADLQLHPYRRRPRRLHLRAIQPVTGGRVSVGGVVRR